MHKALIVKFPNSHSTPCFLHASILNPFTDTYVRTHIHIHTQSLLLTTPHHLPFISNACLSMFVANKQICRTGYPQGIIGPLQDYVRWVEKGP
jgi:hypothetical protein